VLICVYAFTRLRILCFFKFCHDKADLVHFDQFQSGVSGARETDINYGTKTSVTDARAGKNDETKLKYLHTYVKCPRHRARYGKVMKRLTW